MRLTLQRGICLALALVLVPLVAEAKRKHLPDFEWGLDVSGAAIYNSNLIGISAHDRNTFLSDPVLFPTPLESVDDLENEFQIHPNVRWRAPLNLMIGADYRFKYVHRDRNTFSDYQSHSFSLSARPRVAGYRWSTRLRMFGIPSYYVRVYKDRDYNEWDAARYANFDYSLSGRYRWWRSLWSEAGLGYGTYYYNRKFTEYDSEYRYVSLGSGYEFAPDLSLNTGYTRRISDNVGKSQPGVSRIPPDNPDQIVDTEYGDSDFNEDDWSAQAIYRPVRWTSLPVEASASYRLRRRVYTTDRPLDLDPFHRGRLDKRGTFTLGLNVKAVSRLEVEPYFTYDERWADSMAPQVPLVKNYVRREYGLTLTYTIK
jgi:hypothetical protein